MHLRIFLLSFFHFLWIYVKRKYILKYKYFLFHHKAHLLFYSTTSTTEKKQMEEKQGRKNCRQRMREALLQQIRYTTKMRHGNLIETISFKQFLAHCL